MTEPIYDTTTERVYHDLPQHYQVADSRNDWPLKRWWRGITGQMGDLEALKERISYTPPDDGGVLGETSDLVDPATIDPAWIDWRAQFTGMKFPANIPLSEKRALLADVNTSLEVGTRAALVAAVKSALAGDHYVNLYKNSTSTADIGTASMWDVLIVTKASETLEQKVPDFYTQASQASAWKATVDAGSLIPQVVEKIGMYEDRAIKVTTSTSGLLLMGMRNASAADRFSVVATETVTVGVYLQGTGVTEAGFLRVKWYDAAGTFLSSSQQAITIGITAMTQYTGSWVVPATATTASIEVEATAVAVGYSLYLAQVGARTGTNTTWIVRTSDPVGTAIALGAKPAGIVLHHDTFSADWNTIETNFPTWSDWEVRNWNEITEGGV